MAQVPPSLRPVVRLACCWGCCLLSEGRTRRRGRVGWAPLSPPRSSVLDEYTYLVAWAGLGGRSDEKTSRGRKRVETGWPRWVGFVHPSKSRSAQQQQQQQTNDCRSSFSVPTLTIGFLSFWSTVTSTWSSRARSLSPTGTRSSTSTFPSCVLCFPRPNRA